VAILADAVTTSLIGAPFFFGVVDEGAKAVVKIVAPSM